MEWNYRENCKKKTFQDFEQKVSTTIFLHRRFEMRNFSAEKEINKSGDWKSLAMYTHVGGYKFCVGVDDDGCGRGKSINVDLWALPGEFDDQLKWPAEVTIKIELINQQWGFNVTRVLQKTWNKPRFYTQIGVFQDNHYIGRFLKDDYLVF